MLGRPELRPPVITVGSLEHLTNMAITAFEVLQTGSVGVGGSTGAVVHRSLLAIRAGLAVRPATENQPI